MKTSGNQITLVIALICIGAAVSLAKAAEPMTLDKSTIDTQIVVGSDQFHNSVLTGIFYGVEEPSKALIIDDTLVGLAPVVTFNGNSWSRGRLRGQLERGDKLEFKIDPDAESQIPIINVINKIE